MRAAFSNAVSFPRRWGMNKSVTLFLHRKFSSNSKKGKTEALEYLQSWIGKGNGKSTTKSVQKKVNRSKNQSNRTSLKTTPTNNVSAPSTPLFITGSSYLLPTLRIERTDTPNSLAHQIDASISMASSGHSSTTMLIGKPISSSSSSKSYTKTKRWKVPLILDLGAFQPDGSPHFIPPTKDMLKGIIRVLAERGIKVMGIANAPMNLGPIGNLSGSDNVEEIVNSLGLPPVMGMRSRGNIENLTLAIEDIVQLVKAKEEKEDEANEGEIMEDGDTNSGESKSDGNEDRQTRLHNTLEKATLSEIIEDTKTANTSIDSENSLTSSSSSAPPLSTTPISTAPTTAKIYHGNVRTGQQISAEQNRSLIILGSVHSGGEVMADADIYVYGKLNGRALAGLNGESSAKILASQFDAELVCIGGIYTTVDDVTDFGLRERGCPALVEVDLEEGALKFQEIAL